MATNHAAIRQVRLLIVNSTLHFGGDFCPRLAAAGPAAVSVAKAI
jgi:hypothetical protein